MKSLRTTKQQKLQILKLARKLLARPKGWVKGAARRQLDYNTGFVAYCAIGAVQQAAADVTGEKVEFSQAERLARNSSLSKKCRELHGKGIITFNDGNETKKRDVLALFDAKISELESELA